MDGDRNKGRTRTSKQNSRYEGRLQLAVVLLSVFLSVHSSSKAWSDSKIERLSEKFDIFLHCGTEPDLSDAIVSLPGGAILSEFALYFEGFNPAWLEDSPELFREDAIIKSYFDDRRIVLSNLHSGCWIEISSPYPNVFSSKFLRDGHYSKRYSNTVRQIIAQRSCNLESSETNNVHGNIIIGY